MKRNPETGRFVKEKSKSLSKRMARIERKFTPGAAADILRVHGGARRAGILPKIGMGKS
jgi:hypothetical protein